MVLTQGPNGPAVFSDHTSLQIRLRRDADDLDRFSRLASTCEDLRTAATLLKLECPDLEAEFDPATPAEQAEIDARTQLGQALDHLVEAVHLTEDEPFRLVVRRAIKDLRKLEGD